MDKEQLLENYFSHRLTPEQEVLFHDLLERDADFKEQFNFEQDLKRIIKAKENKNLKADLNRFESDIRQKSPAGSKGGYQTWAIAASVIVLVGLGWLGYTNFMGTNYGELYKDNFQEYPNTVYTISRGDTVESLEREAFAAYESGNFQTALNNFDKILPSDQKPYLDFYRALSYLQLNKTEEAKKLFIKSIKNDGAFVPESHWYLALAYLKEKDKENAILQLQELTLHYDFNKEKANALLRELK